MKKQTAAVMSAVTLISSVNVPVVPAFAMENQEEVQEIIEQNEREQIVVPVAEDGVGEEVFEEVAEEATQDVIEVTEITNEEIKEGEMNEGTTEEVNQETGSEELTEDVKEEVITEESTKEVKQEETVIEGQETEDALIGTKNLTESEGETKELEVEVQAQEEVDIPDINLKSAINKQLGRAEDSAITKVDLLGLTSLEASNKNIKELTGLEFAINLEYLNLSGNQISDLTPLKDLINLTSLSLAWNQIVDLSPISDLMNLRELFLQSNMIKDPRVINNLSKLESLSLGENEIIDLNFLKELTNLKSLSLDNNQLSDLTPLTNLTNLTFLDLDNNTIKEIKPLENLVNLEILVLDHNQVSDLSVLDNLSHLNFSAHSQEIQLNPVYIMKGGTIKISNPLSGQLWNLDFEHATEEECETFLEITNGYYNGQNNMFIFENVINNEVQFTFSSTKYGGSRLGGTSGTVTIPVTFYEVSDVFTEFVSNDVFNVIGGTGESDDLLVLEVVEGTELEALKSLLAKYSDYDLTVTKKVTKERATTAVESYLLTFKKGEEQASFEVHVPTTETDMINYLNSLTDQPEQPDQPDQSGQPEQPENKPAEEKPVTTTPNVNKPTTQQNTTTQHPQTGLSGFMGVIGVGTLSLAAVITRRKKQ